MRAALLGSLAADTGIQFVAGRMSAGPNGTDSVVLNYPTTRAVDDIMIAVVINNVATNFSGFDIPAPWLPLATITGGQAMPKWLCVAWMRYASGTAATFQQTAPGELGNALHGGIISYRGCTTVESPVDGVFYVEDGEPPTRFYFSEVFIDAPTATGASQAASVPTTGAARVVNLFFNYGGSGSAAPTITTPATYASDYAGVIGFGNNYRFGAYSRSVSAAFAFGYPGGSITHTEEGIYAASLSFALMPPGALTHSSGD